MGPARFEFLCAEYKFTRKCSRQTVSGFGAELPAGTRVPGTRGGFSCHFWPFIWKQHRLYFLDPFLVKWMKRRLLLPLGAVTAIHPDRGDATEKEGGVASTTASAVDESAASSASCTQSHSAMAVQGEASVVDGARCAHSPCLRFTLLAPPYVRTAPHRTARTSCIFQQRLTSCA